MHLSFVPVNMDLIASKSLENKPEWEEWREEFASENKHVVFGSQFPVWFGLGYESLASVVDTLHGRKDAVNKKDDPFVQKAMQHGTNNEKAAIDLFMQVASNSEYFKYNTVLEKARPLKFDVLTDLPSGIFKLAMDPEALLSLTPDALLVVSNPETKFKSVCVLEVKCPYNQRHKFDSIDEWVDSFRKSHPLGYPAAFYQAALYAASEANCSEFFTLFYFVHEATNTRRLVAFGFNLTDELRTEVLYNASQFSRCLREGKKGLRVPSERKKQALELHKKAHLITVVTESEFITFSGGSNEQDSKESGQ